MKNANCNVLVTGANGFIGGHLVASLVAKGHRVRAIVRSDVAARHVPENAEVCRIDNAADADCWNGVVANCDTVIHLIGLAHASARESSDQIERFRAVNVGITSLVVQACLRQGVRRLIFLSSIGAVGTGAPETYVEASECRPENAYGISKREAELLILQQTHDSPIEAAIVRPPMVYGEGAPGNVPRMMKLVHSRIPLPIRCLTASRSMVYVRNLTDALCAMVESRCSVEGIYHISDAEPPMTTRELLVELGRLMGRRVVEVPVPAPVLRLIGQIVGMGGEVDRLTRSLTTQSVRLTDELGWRPPYSMQEGFSATVKWFVDHESEREEA